MVSKDGDARARLQQAALELFQERGYEQTTAAAIAARANVTERTFFRYFPDKREVLFGGEATLRAALLGALETAPLSLGPLDALFHAFHATESLLVGNRPFAKPRQAIISSTPTLREREVAKHAALTDILVDALQRRGVSDLQAVLAAHAGMAAFVLSTLGWLDNPEPGLRVRLEKARQELASLLDHPELPTGQLET